MPKYKTIKNVKWALKQVVKHFPKEQFTSADLAKKTEYSIMFFAMALGKLHKEEKLKLMGKICFKNKKGRPQYMKVWQLNRTN